MLADHKRTALAWVKWANAEAGTGIPDDRVLWGQQDATAPRPRIELLVTGELRLGPVPARKSTGSGGAAVHTSTRMGEATVSVVVVGKVARESLDEDADSIMALLEPQLYEPDVDTVLTDLGVKSVSMLPSLDALTGQSQWETRAALDVTFNLSTVTTSNPGTVETVEVDVTTTPPGLISTPQTIGA